MGETVRTHLDLHRDLMEIAQAAVKQVVENPVGNDTVLPLDIPARPSDPAVYDR